MIKVRCHYASQGKLYKLGVPAQNARLFVCNQSNKL